MNSNLLYRYNNLEICVFNQLPDRFPAHSHNHWLIGMLLAGEKNLQLQNSLYILHPFELITLNPKQIHSCKSANSESGRWICFNIHHKFIANIFPNYAILNQLFNTSVFNYYDLAGDIQKINPKVDGFNKIEAQLKSILERIVYSQKTSEKKAMVNDKHRSLILQFCTRLEERAQFNLDLEQMAESIGLNRFHFLRLFKKYVGVTPHRYIETLRLLKARELLDKDYPLSTIAIESGYWDQPHFNRSFKAALGFTPKYMRNSQLL